MSYVSKLLACAFISTIIFASSEVGAQSWQAKELVCRGQATLGNDTISDELGVSGILCKRGFTSATAFGLQTG